MHGHEEIPLKLSVTLFKLEPLPPLLILPFLKNKSQHFWSWNITWEQFEIEDTIGGGRKPVLA